MKNAIAWVLALIIYPIRSSRSCTLVWPRYHMISGTRFIDCDSCSIDKPFFRGHTELVYQKSLKNIVKHSRPNWFASWWLDRSTLSRLWVLFFCASDCNGLCTYASSRWYFVKLSAIYCIEMNCVNWTTCNDYCRRVSLSPSFFS